MFKTKCYYHTNTRIVFRDIYEEEHEPLFTATEKETQCNPIDELNLAEHILDNVPMGSLIHSDEMQSYKALKYFYKHKMVKHSVGEYVSKKDKTNHINGMENFFGTFKRGILGIYHHVSKKYLQAYVNEFCFRYNNRENVNTFNLLINQTVYAK
jgi:hypothetical protein